MKQSLNRTASKSPSFPSSVPVDITNISYLPIYRCKRLGKCLLNFHSRLDLFSTPGPVHSRFLGLCAQKSGLLRITFVPRVRICFAKYAHSDANQKKVIVKTAPSKRLEVESNILKEFKDHPSFRQLLDKLDDPPVLILEYLERNLMEAAHQQTLSRPAIKRVAKGLLEALGELHDKGLVHTSSFRVTKSCPCADHS